MNKVAILEQLRVERRNYNKSWMNSYTEVGDFTYADHPRIWTWNDKTKLYIGKFCSIGANVQFLLGGEHHTEWCTTYPFNVLTPSICPNEETTAASRGDIRIGNDVWIGNDVKILSGVTVGDGAVIGSSAVVAKNILPYQIVVGNPATSKFKEKQYRISPIIAVKILNIKWWNWSLDKLAEALPILCSKDYNALLKFHEEWDQKFDN